MRSSRARLALIAAAFIAVGCSKREATPPPVAKPAIPKAVDCPAERVFQASRLYESAHYDLAIATLRIQSRSQDPPDAYIASLEDDLKYVDETIARSTDYDAPPCLRTAREIFLQYLAESREALNLRRPTASLTRVRQVEAAAKETLERHREELAKQQAVARAIP